LSDALQSLTAQLLVPTITEVIVYGVLVHPLHEGFDVRNTYVAKLGDNTVYVILTSAAWARPLRASNLQEVLQLIFGFQRTA